MPKLAMMSLKVPMTHSMGLKVCLTALFLVFLSGCDVPRPDTTFCLNNVKSLEQICYNLKTDYDSNGELNKDAKPVIVQYSSPQAMLLALDRSFETNSSGWANLKSYLRNLRAANQ